MKFDLGDFGFKEQAELMNLLNQCDGNNQTKNNQSIGFNEDTIYQWIDLNKDKS